MVSRWFFKGNTDKVDSILFLFLSVFILFLSTRMDSFGETVLSPGTFPALGAGVLFFLALALFFKAIRQELSSCSDDVVHETKWKSVMVVTLLCLVYVWVLPLLHFVISTMCFLSMFLVLIGERRIWMVSVVSISTTLLIYFIFGTMLKVLLP